MTPVAAPFNGLFQVNLGQPVPLILPSLFWKTTCGSVFCNLVVPVTQLCQSTERNTNYLPINCGLALSFMHLPLDSLSLDKHCSGFITWFFVSISEIYVLCMYVYIDMYVYIVYTNSI